MKNLIITATLFTLLVSGFSTTAVAQCSVASTDGYVVHVKIVPQTVIVSSMDCPDGYNYNIGYSYSVTFTGANIPSALYTLQTLISCNNGQINGGYGMPLSGGLGTSVTSTNPYVGNSGTAYSYVGKPNCTQASVQTLNCNNITLIIQGPGIPYQTISCNNTMVPLPVELVDYQGMASDDGVELNWSTASELNNQYYTVYNSTDGYSWKQLTRIKGAGTTTSYNAYDFVDKAPANGQNYYKLTQTDENGHETEQGVVGVEVVRENTGFATVFPNPSADGTISMRVVSSDDTPVIITVTDEFGRVVTTMQLAEAVKSGNRFIVQETLQLPQQKQVYFLDILQDGASLGRQKVVVL